MNIKNKRVRAMEGSEIAEWLGVSKQYISFTIRKGLGKMYMGLQTKNPDLSPFEIIEALRNFLGIEDQDDIDIFFNLFPKDIKENIKKSKNIIKKIDKL